MRHPDGLKVSLMDETRLDQSGILSGTAGTAKAYGLTDGAVALFLAVASAGDGGLAQSRIPKDLRTDLSLHLLPLELQELVAWERDNRGRLAYLVLTWKGQETLEAARPHSQAPSTLAASRRASVR